VPPTQFTLILPLYVGGHTRTLKNGSQAKPNKKYWLNLNQYRNWHYRTAGTTKKLFKEAIAPQILALPDLTGLWGRVHLHYAMYSPSHQKRDLMNSVSIIDKYFSDALVELGKLSDDDLHTITSLSCKVENVDKDNPRMEVTITP
jgi:Holliday junction resolvase RusA-like endonuclease